MDLIGFVRAARQADSLEFELGWRVLGGELELMKDLVAEKNH